jgi:cell division septal protein FtsQ
MFLRNKKQKFFSRKKYFINRPQVKYKNPFRKRKRFFEFKLFKIINLILLLSIIICLYFFLFSNFYNINEIEVGGNQIISTNDVLDIINNYLAKHKFLIFSTKNIFIFNKNDIKKEINKAIILRDLQVEKELPNKIRINLQEKDVALKWITADSQYMIDNQGQIIKKYYKLQTPSIFQLDSNSVNVTVSDNDNLSKIKDLSDKKVNLGDFVLNAENVQFIQDLLTRMKTYGLYNVAEIQVPNQFPQYLSLMMAAGWKIDFNLKDSLDEQLKRLEIIVNQKIKKENLNNVDYIDLKLGESIYYKMK